MDDTVPGVHFDSAGVCNFCTEFLAQWSASPQQPTGDRGHQLEQLVSRVKTKGQGRRYDCVVGVSGGADSSWVLVQTVRLGLRPLAVHMDNGWNSELAQNNISNLVRGLGLDLYTHVIDWGEYRRLMQAFFDADVIDVELLYDNAMLAVNYQQAARHGVKFILAGTNQATEGMRMPTGWNWNKFDSLNIKAIARRFGGAKLDTFPAIGTLGRLWYRYLRGVRWISFLDYLDYNKQNAIDEMQSMYGYKPYQYKHYESIFTRFYQGCILPQKFGVDKRRLHLSTLVAAGQMTRDDALRDLEKIPYPSEEALESDRLYFLKKMGWTRSQFDDYLARPPKPHTAYPTELLLLRRSRDLARRIGYGASRDGSSSRSGS